ncbi:FAD-NAD(P)-binding [Georgenia satyanarayanai]|uniref:FAD-NAD(P)-binding n=1 Tax=Georgenia satyanarayanai TaxID=860221 RepID=A0A2Y9ASQ5_9MICO|nr:FAD/NAD(P)-binding protein [Georgenia satyanarayanai]PYF97252.1 FAD-NAD(P)-binding protein [Georgenia satyanarayanai]SSA46338.1 FAD-NAD(P)-binding [Georgenia satyanarayanai]
MTRPTPTPLPPTPLPADSSVVTGAPTFADSSVVTDGALSADVVIVGGGPRAASVVERLTARGTPERPVRVVVVDRFEVGAGATWRTDQSPQLLNNTYSAHTTIYPDDSTPMSGPVTTGPDLVQWARDVVAGVPRPTAPASAGWSAGSRPDWVAEEAAAVQPWSYPTRRLQGVYFREQLEAILARGGVELTAVVGTVVDIEPVTAELSAEEGAPATRELSAEEGALSAGSESRRVVRLADGRAFSAAAVVLAQGMVQAERSRQTEERVAAAEDHGLVYVEPGMPAERDWDVVPGGQDVVVAGLGANFFDVVAVLTAGRGGRFVPGDSPFDLTYLPSGREPRLLVGSRRGLPYRSKSWYGALPPRYTPRLATPEWFAAAATVPDQDFARDVWPQLAREFVVAHLTTLVRHHPATVPSLTADDGELPAGLLARLAAADVSELDGLVRDVVVDPARHLDVERLDRPDVRLPSPEAWRAWTERWVAAEHESITRPLASPRAEVNRAMAVLRGQVAGLVRAGAIHPASAVRDVNGWFGTLGLALASGPPPERTAQLLALVRAGVVELLGEGLSVTVERGRFVARTQVIGREHRVRAFVETRMSKGHADVTDDPLLRSLLDSGRARLHARTGPDGTVAATRTLDVTPEEFHLLDAAGRPDPRVVVIGIPAGDVQPGSAIGATPGVPSPLIAGADRAAAQVLALVREAVPVG